MSFANVGKRWSPGEFPAWLAGLPRPSWAKSVTIHHCSAPSLAQRPDGFLSVHLENLRGYYRDRLGWSRGPHFFVDDDEIFGMTPPTIKGTHAVSFNSSSIGFEMLGDYDSEDPLSGRGLAVCRTTARAASDVLDWLGLEPSAATVKFHRDDPRTSKTCPGRKVGKEWFLGLMRDSAIAEPPSAESVEFAPVVKRAMAALGRSYAETARLLKREGKLYFLGGHWLEGAHYNPATGDTVAPVGEIEDAVEKIAGGKK